MAKTRLHWMVCLAMIPAVLSDNIALIIIDVQNCFLPGGSLAVKDGQEVIPIINNIRTKYEHLFQLVVLSQDWHCSDHISFASQHNGSSPYQEIVLQYDADGALCDQDHACAVVEHNVTQMLWPDHCVINSTSAEFDTSLIRKDSDIIIRKGYNCDVDSYSAFYDNGKFTHTELHQKLQTADIQTVFVTGLALDYCVYYTSSDAKRLGYKTFIVEDASRGVAEDTSVEAVADMKSQGVHVIQSADVGSILESITGTASSPGRQVGVVYLISLMVTFAIFLKSNTIQIEI